MSIDPILPIKKKTDLQNGYKTGTNPCFIQEVHLNIKHRYFIIDHRWKIIFKEIKQQNFIVILVFDKRNFMPKLIKDNKERHYMLIREIIH